MKKYTVKIEALVQVKVKEIKMAWKHTLKLKDLLSDEGDQLDPMPPGVLEAVVRRLQEFSSLNSHTFLFGEMKKVKTIADFNAWLDKLYNWADQECVWID